MRGASQEFCRYTDENHCISLPENWKNVMSSLKSEHRIFLYSLPNCDGTEILITKFSACRSDFRSVNFWLPYDREDMNDNSESISILEDLIRT